MNISIESIKEMAFSLEEFNRGESIYLQDNVREIQVEQAPSCIELNAKVREENKLFSVAVDLIDHKIAWHNCGCLENYRRGICRHLVAVLLKYHDCIMPELRKAIKGGRYSKSALEYYENQLMKEQDIKVSQHAALIKAVVKLIQTDKTSFALGLSVGETRLYIVKDVYEFSDYMKSGEMAGYGKNLEFIHDLAVFEPEAHPMLQFIIDKTTEYDFILKHMGFYKGFSKADRKYLVLNAKAFDEFFTLVKDKKIEYVNQEKVSDEIECVEGNPHFSLSIEKQEDHYKLSPSIQEYIPVESATYKYIITEHRLYRLTEGFANYVFPLLNEMYYAENANGAKHLEFTQNLMKRFMLSSLERVKKYVPVFIEEDIEEFIQPIHAIVRSFFDVDEAGSIIGEVEIEYPDIIFNPYKALKEDEKKKLQEIARDTPTEYKLDTLLRCYDFHTQGGQLYLADEAKIYDFIESGMGELLSIGEVNITDRLKGIKVIKKSVGSLGIRLQNNMLYVALENINIGTDEIYEILNAYKKRNKYYRLKDGSYMNLKEGITGDIVNIVEGLGVNVENLIDKEVEIPKYRALYLDHILKNSEEMQVSRDKYFKQIIRDVKNIEDADDEVPKSIKAELRTYQKTGYRWLKTMANYQFGGILADDMGLGKTLQMITLLTDNYEKGEALPSLVVCPMSLALNWKAEFNKFSPNLKVKVIMGTVSERQLILEAPEEAQIFITSYDLLKRDIELYETLKFKYCIADEAQYIKNPNTIGAKCVKAVKAEVRFALTGTPIENSLSELWSLFDFIMPNYLFTYPHFRDHFEALIVKNEDNGATERLKKMIAPFIMRRLKKDVLKELPDKTETVIYNCMEEAQKKLYTAHLALARKEIRDKLYENTSSGNRVKMLALLTRLRQICCHPCLYIKDYEEKSGKLEQCIEIVKESIVGGHKILIFSQFTTMLDIIGRRLKEEGIEYFMLTGMTKAEQRIEMVSDFNHTEVPVFLISLKAGGTGLNLTGADVVIHYDPWWNLSSQNQATDRAYRIGQKKNVQVFEMITKDSIEERIKELQDRKIGLTDRVLQEGESFISKMSEQELIELFSES